MLKDLLKPGYEKRAEIHSLLFKDHKLPIHDVHFTIDVTEGKDLGQQANKTNSNYQQSSDAQYSALQDKSDGEGVQKPIVVAEIFTSKVPKKEPAEFTHGELADRPEEKQQQENSKAQLVSQPQTEIHRVLVLGKAGSGKTTLSKYIAYEWVNNRLWEERYDQIFWITLRDLHSVDEEKLQLCLRSPFPLAALIWLLCLDKNTCQKITIEAIHHLLITQPQHTLIIGDGFDEVAQLLSELVPDGDPAKLLLQTILNTKCDLVVTSREYSPPPPAEIPFDCRLENKGFTHKQVMSYIISYFDSLPDAKRDPALKQEVQRLIRNNVRLWSYAHNPLILMLVCDFYRNAKENGKGVLSDLSLLDLYDNTFNIFIRRYLDGQSKMWCKPELDWQQTKKLGLEELLSKCPLEVTYLQELAYLAVEQSVQRIDRKIKEQALNAVLAKYPKHPREKQGRFDQALNLGFLHEFSGTQDSLLDRIHEFSHLTVQEYLAARQIAERLKRHDHVAYAWLRENKYHPGYRELLNFICAMMSPEKYSVFWQVLLEETSGLTGFAHLKLIMYSLEAVRCDEKIPQIKMYLETIRQLIITNIQLEQFNEMYEFFSSLRYCPTVIRAISKNILDEIRQKIEQKNVNQILFFLRILVDQAAQLTLPLRQQLFNLLLTIVQIYQLGKDLLTSYVERESRFLENGKSEVMEMVLNMARDKNNSDRKNVILGLGFCTEIAYRFSEKQRSELVKTLLSLTQSENVSERESVMNFLSAYFTLMQINPALKKENSEILGELLKFVRTGKHSVLKVLILYVKNVGQYTKNEHSEILQIFLRLSRSEKSDETESALQVLENFIQQSSRFLEEERVMMLEEFLKMEKSENLVEKQHALRLLAFWFQRGQFLEEKRSEILKIFLNAAQNRNINEKINVFYHLQSFVEKAALFSEKERTEILDVFLKFAESGKAEIFFCLKCSAEKADLFSEKERTKILDIFLRLARSEEPHERAVADDALKSYVAQAYRFPKK